MRKMAHHGPGRLLLASAALWWLGACAPAPEPQQQAESKGGGVAGEIRFMTLDPGHFHAALVQKEMYSGVSPRVHVYAPLGPDLADHLQRIAGYNTRAQNSTTWTLEVHASPDFMERIKSERPGNVVVISGRNRGKIDKILASIDAGFHVLSDKPWIIDPADMPKLEEALKKAEQSGLIAYDIMTERYEITSMLQKELVNDASVFGEIQAGTEQEPGVYMHSVHHLLKLVSGVPNRRPPWFFDVEQQGEGIPDVGTHLADLVQWMLAPNQAVDYRTDIQVLSARRWPTVMTLADFQRVTGRDAFPDYLGKYLRDGKLDYYCNTAVSYTLRGTHVKLEAAWNYQAPPGTGDTHLAVFRGSKARVEVRQGAVENYRPELYVVPAAGVSKAELGAALQSKISALSATYAGVAVKDLGKEWRIVIPDAFHVGHEAHFAEVTDHFLEYVRDPAKLPAWENPNMLAKYYVTTQSLKLARGAAN